MLPQVLFDTRFLTCPELDDGVRGQYKLKGLQRGKIRTRVKVTKPYDGAWEQNFPLYISGCTIA